MGGTPSFDLEITISDDLFADVTHESYWYDKG
jgi:hypothetical protein